MFVLVFSVGIQRNCHPQSLQANLAFLIFDLQAVGSIIVTLS